MSGAFVRVLDRSGFDLHFFDAGDQFTLKPIVVGDSPRGSLFQRFDSVEEFRDRRLPVARTNDAWRLE